LKEIHGEGHVIDATSEFLQQLQAIFAGETGYTGIVKTLDLHLVSAEEVCGICGLADTSGL
jgi:hypothetical protein